MWRPLLELSFSFSVELVNSQVMLQGIETKGCVLVTAGNTRILNRLHRPVWSKGELFNKKTWVGKVENVQVRTGKLSFRVGAKSG